MTWPFLFFTAALYLSFSPAGSPSAVTLYAAPFVGTSYPISASVALKYLPTVRYAIGYINGFSLRIPEVPPTITSTS